MMNDARKMSKEAQEVLRVKVVRAVEEGMPQVEAVRVFDVSRAAVAKWMKRYREGGEGALRGDRRGRPRKSRLVGWQAAAIVNIVTDRTPDQVKMDFMLWTRQAVANLIERKFGLRLSVWTVGRYLKRWGFTPQRPMQRALEQDPKAVRRWLEEEYPAIRREAKREGAEIYWGDEMGLKSDQQGGRTYGRRGRTPVIPKTGQRFGFSIISAITNRGTLRFMAFRGRFLTDLFVKFLERLVKDVGRRVYLIVDGHPVHKARRVKRWLEENEERIRLFFLPTYSPELNPDEMLNNDVKANAVRRRRATTLPEMMSDVRVYLQSTQKRPDIVRSYFWAESVRYAAS
jgi:transposase